MRWRKGRPSDVYKVNEDLTGLYKDEDFRTPKTLSGCKPNDSQKSSDGLTDLFKVKGLSTLQTRCRPRIIHTSNEDLTALYDDDDFRTPKICQGANLMRGRRAVMV